MKRNIEAEVGMWLYAMRYELMQLNGISTLNFIMCHMQEISNGTLGIMKSDIEYLLKKRREAGTTNHSESEWLDFAEFIRVELSRRNKNAN